MTAVSSHCSILLFHTKRLLRETSGDQFGTLHCPESKDIMKAKEAILKGLSAVK